MLRWTWRLALALTLLWGCGSKSGLALTAGEPTPADATAAPDVLPDVPPDVGTDLCVGADLVIRYGPGGASPARLSLSAAVRIPQADVYFLLDTTGSMVGEIRAMRSAVIGLITALSCPATGRRCSDDRDCTPAERCSPEGRCGPAPEVGGCLPDLHVGVGRYAGRADSYRHLLDVSAPSGATTRAIPRLADGLGWGEALYQSVSCVVGSGRCPSAGCAASGRGCGGFRARSLPIIVAITDEGDECTGGWIPGGCLATPTTTGSALRNFGATFVGIDADAAFEATPFLEAIANEAGSLDETGRPLVFSGSGTDVVAAVRRGLRAVASIPLRLHADLEDLPGDDGDARAFVDHVEVDTTSRGCFPYRDLTDTDGDGYNDTVIAAGPGTRGCLDVVLRDRAPSAGPREYRMRLQMRAGGAIVDEATVCIAVP